MSPNSLIYFRAVQHSSVETNVIDSLGEYQTQHLVRTDAMFAPFRSPTVTSNHAEVINSLDGLQPPDLSLVTEMIQRSRPINPLADGVVSALLNGSVSLAGTGVLGLVASASLLGPAGFALAMSWGAMWGVLQYASSHQAAEQDSLLLDLEFFSTMVRALPTLSDRNRIVGLNELRAKASRAGGVALQRMQEIDQVFAARYAAGFR